MREAQFAPDSFVRAAPLPSWVQRQAVPPTQRREPVVLRLRDAQVRIGESVSTFVDRAIHVNDSAALRWSFRNAEGGVLMNAFNPRWSDLQEANGDLDERKPFNALLEEVDGTAGAVWESDVDDSPGLSSCLHHVLRVFEGQGESARRFERHLHGLLRRAARVS